jgi:hypothetical protein
MPITTTSYSVYPNDYDGYGNLQVVRDNVTEIRARDHNSLRDAIVKIEQELGLNPSGDFGTVASRLDNVTDASALINAHLVDPLDAHDASAISVLDSSDYYVGDSVEEVLDELAAALPTALDVIGANNILIPNSGLPWFTLGAGTLGLYNTSGGANILKRTQPVAITGVHVIEIGILNGPGVAQLTYTAGTTSLRWQAPGDALGAATDISGLSAGQIILVPSSTATKQIRIARTSASLPAANQTENFEVLRLDGGSGYMSVTGSGFVSSDHITRTAISATDPSRSQFTIGGTVYPADRGTLVLQRKLREDGAFIPIATLDLSANFTEANRTTGQVVYVPTLADFDTITLFDRHPARNDYDDLTLDSDGAAIYSNYDISVTYGPSQLAKYSIPASNSDLVSGTLTAPTSITAAQMGGTVSVYRVVHYRVGVTSFSGEPAAADIYSVSDALGAASDGSNTVRMGNVLLDSNTTRPTISQMVLRPVVDAEVQERIVSGIHYYNGLEDYFDVEMRSNTNAFSNSYQYFNFLRLTSDVFASMSLDVNDCMDDGYVAFSAANLPTFTDRALYMINATYNTADRLFPASDSFSMNAHVTGRLFDPFESGASFDAYGTAEGQIVRVLVNSYDRYRATETIEYFTDESLRIGTAEIFDFDTDRDQFTNTYQSNPDGYRLELWDNTIPLTAGELQVGGLFDADDYLVPGLIQPQDDFSAGIRPTQDGTADYSAAGYEVDSIYQRLFNLGHTISHGRIRIESGGHFLVSFSDLYDGNTTRPMKIELKIPGLGPNSTGWLDVGKLFANSYEDGDGCLYGATSGSTGDLTLPFTFGARNNGDANGMVAVRVTYFSAYLSVAQTKIITAIELLDAE